MSTEHNSKLIASLYEESDVEKATEIADEMQEIKDPIFIQPIYSAYKRFKETTMAHYFLSDLKFFKTPETKGIFEDIAASKDTEKIDFSYCLDYLNDIEYVEPWLTSRTFQFFLEEISKDDTTSYFLGDLLKYLVRAKIEIPLDDYLTAIFEDEKKKVDTRKTALQFFFRKNPKDNIKYYFDNYERIKGTRAETIVANEIADWKDGLIPAFKEKIIREGSSRAREIIESVDKKEEVKIAEREKDIEIKYNNAQIITEIAQLRSKINTLTNGDAKFGFQLFPPTELIYQQTEGASDRQKLVGYCMELRSFIQELDKENLLRHGLSPEEIKELIPGIENQPGSINLLHLYLLSKKIETEEELFGLRKLNQVVAKLAHPDESKDLTTLLKKENLFDIYKEEDFPILHRRLLEKYRDFLVRLFEAIKKSAEK